MFSPEPVKPGMNARGWLPEELGFLKMAGLGEGSVPSMALSIGSDLLRFPCHQQGDFVQQAWPLPVAWVWS